MNDQTANGLPQWLPFVIGGVLVIQFAGLGVWQVARALEKQADQAQFDSAGSYATHYDGIEVRPYQRLQATGHYVGTTQFLIDNIIIESRIGAYVVTPLETGDDEPVLLVNRGWIPRDGLTLDESRIGIGAGRTTVHGRVGSLPRAGMRMGEAIEDDDWPLTAVYPTLDELAIALEREVQPYVLLLDPESDDGFLRHWVPKEMGPGRHYAYAFQWFAMAGVLAALLAWNWRRLQR